MNGDKWQYRRLGDIADIFRGCGLSKSQITESGRNLCILYGELFTHYSRVIRKVVSQTNANEGVLSVKGDILMPGSTTTTGVDLATASALMADDVLLGGDVNIIRIKDNLHDSVFLAYYLTNAKREITEIARGITVHHLHSSSLKDVSVYIPALSEQKAIAEALSDADAWIESIERLIAKKRLIKQGAMQQLLTGKTRLPGFSGAWEDQRLADIADIFRGSGLSKSKISSSGRNPCILYGELFTHYSRVIRKVFSQTNINEGVLSVKGDILMPGSTTTTGVDLATASALMLDDVLLGGDINIIRIKDNRHDSVFLAYYLTSAKQEIVKLARGITVHHLHGSSLKDMPVRIPALLSEQRAIAGALTDMDTEIAKLERKLAKALQIKQGLTQNLLSGIIRLI